MCNMCNMCRLWRNVYLSIFNCCCCVQFNSIAHRWKQNNKVENYRAHRNSNLLIIWSDLKIKWTIIAEKTLLLINNVIRYMVDNIFSSYFWKFGLCGCKRSGREKDPDFWACFRSRYCDSSTLFLHSSCRWRWKEVSRNAWYHQVQLSLYYIAFVGLEIIVIVSQRHGMIACIWEFPRKEGMSSSRNTLLFYCSIWNSARSSFPIFDYPKR